VPRSIREGAIEWEEASLEAASRSNLAGRSNRGISNSDAGRDDRAGI